MRRGPPARRPGGIGLIELIISMLVVSVAIVGVLSVMNLTTARSADPVLVAQAQAVAHTYLEEILLRAFADPDGVEAGETRATFDDVDDYDGLAANGCLSATGACPLGACACDQFGNPVEGLSGYRVAVDVNGTALNGAPAQRVDVRVTHVRSPAVNLLLSGFRTAY